MENLKHFPTDLKASKALECIVAHASDDSFYLVQLTQTLLTHSIALPKNIFDAITADDNIIFQLLIYISTLQGRNNLLKDYLDLQEYMINYVNTVAIISDSYFSYDQYHGNRPDGVTSYKFVEYANALINHFNYYSEEVAEKLQRASIEQGMHYFVKALQANMGPNPNTLVRNARELWSVEEVKEALNNLSSNLYRSAVVNIKLLPPEFNYYKGVT